MEYIDLTPTWKQALDMYIVLLDAGKPQGRKTAIEGLIQMAALADAYVAISKEKAK